MDTQQLIPVIRLVCGTGLLYVIYMAVLKKRVGGNLSRIFLLTGTVIFSVLAFFPLPSPEGLGAEKAYLIALPEISQDSATERESLPSLQFWIYIYLIPVVILGLLFIGKIYKLMRLRHTGSSYRKNGVRMTETPAIRFPFSFGTHVYLPVGLDESTRNIVIKHELVHIRHRHTLDILFFEALKITAWFNPFYFLLEKELRQAHEFTADEVVLNDGTTMEKYCESLLSCALSGMRVPVNYFNGSQIKTRIYMMNKKKNMRQAAVLFTAALLTVGGISATTPGLIGIKNEPVTIVSKPDKLPEFPGGNGAMAKFIIDNLKYPETAKKAKVEGKVVVTFVVNEKGKVTDPTVTKSIGSGCDEEAIRTVKLMPDWKPGEKDGRPVAVEMVLPIQFKLQ